MFKKLSDKGSIDTNDIDDILSNTFGEKIIETKESLEKVSSELLKEENNHPVLNSCLNRHAQHR